MLKLLKPTNLFDVSPTKCGEIFYHNFNDFTIFCTFCKMKSFHFDDFLQHLHNVHLENHLDYAEETKEFNEYLQETISNEAELYETEDVLENCMVQSVDLSRSELDADSYNEEDEFVIVEKLKKKEDFNERERFKSDSKEVLNEASADEFEIEFKPSHHKNENSLSKSEKDNKPQEFSCPECMQIFFLKKDVDSHVFEVHKGYKCSLCNTRFRYRYHLRRHEIKHNPEVKFPCLKSGCSKIYHDLDSLKRHELTHNPEQYFPCTIAECKKIYTQLKYLEKHQSTAHKHTNVKKFVCDICGYSCRAKVSLILHQRGHTGERPFPCELCEKRFVSKTALNIHMLTHSSTRPHVCEICDASFLRIDILRRHMLVHSEEKRFKCYYCDKAFKQPQGLDGHIRRLHMATKAKRDEQTPFS